MRVNKIGCLIQVRRKSMIYFSIWLRKFASNKVMKHMSIITCDVVISLDFYCLRIDFY